MIWIDDDARPTESTLTLNPKIYSDLPASLFKQTLLFALFSARPWRR